MGRKTGRSRTLLAAATAAAALVLGGCETTTHWQSATVSYDGLHGFTANGASTQPVISADGTKVAFTSEARNFGLPDTNGLSDVFVRDLTTGEITLVSVNRLGTNSGNGPSTDPVLSADGTKVAFLSAATNLQSVPMIAGSPERVYVRDLVAGTTTLATVDDAGTVAGRANGGRFELSPDGTKVAFVSSEVLRPYEGPVPFSGLWLRDLVAGTTTLVSVDHTGTRFGNGGSGGPRFSPDGQELAFFSDATDLVAGGTGSGGHQLYVRDLAAGVTENLTPGATGTMGSIRFSGDGSRLVFDTTAENLGPADTNGHTDVYVHDRATGTNTLASVRADGADSGNGPSVHPDISPDGQRVAFETDATDLAGSDGNEERDVAVHDLGTGATEIVSVEADGSTTAAARSRRARFAGDDRVLFESLSWDLGPNDTNNSWDVYLRDLAADEPMLVSEREDGEDSGADDSTTATAVGDRIVYQSRASDTDPDRSDGNGTWDVFVATPYEKPVPETTTTSAPPASTTTTVFGPTTTATPPTTDVTPTSTTSTTPPSSTTTTWWTTTTDPG